MSKFNLSAILPCNTSSDVINFLESSSYGEFLYSFSNSLSSVIRSYRDSGLLLDVAEPAVIDCSEYSSASLNPFQFFLLREVYLSFGRNRKHYLTFLSEVFSKTFPHFSLSEILASPTADIHGISNLPFGYAVYNIPNILPLLFRLEHIRKILNIPIYISSGFRCPKLNKKVGGVGNSRHQYFRALDVVCEDMDSLYELCRSDIFRYVYRGTGYIHIDI